MEERVSNLGIQDHVKNTITLVKENTNYIQDYQTVINSLEQLATINTIANLNYQSTVACLNQIASNATTKIETLSKEAQIYQANIITFEQQAPSLNNNIVDQVQILNRKNQVEAAKKTIVKKQRILDKIKNATQANQSPKQTLLELLGLQSQADIAKTITTYQQLNQLEQHFNINLNNYSQEELKRNLEHQQKELEKAIKMEKNIKQKRNLLQPLLQTLEVLSPNRKQVMKLKADLVTQINNLSRVDTLQNTIALELSTTEEKIEALQAEKPKLFTRTKKGKQIINKIDTQTTKQQQLLEKQEKLNQEKQEIEQQIHTQREALASQQQRLDNISLKNTQLHFDRMLEMKNSLEVQMEKNIKHYSKNPYWNRNDKAELNILLHMDIPATIPTREERDKAIQAYHTKACQLQPKESFVKQIKKL